MKSGVRKSAILVLTDQGLRTAKRIIGSWPDEHPPELWVHKKCQGETRSQGEGFKEKLKLKCFDELKAIVPTLWTDCSLLIFIMASGIVVRHIASLLERKDRDPAVLVLDEKGTFVIPLISGHLGGANAWAREIAQKINAQAVITTATDVNGLIAPDEYARRLGWCIEPLKRLHAVNRFLLDNGYLNIWSDYELPAEHPLRRDPHYRFVDETEKERAHIWLSLPKNSIANGLQRFSFTSGHRTVTPDLVDEFSEVQKETESPLFLIPRVFSIGVGCRKGISTERVLDAIQKALNQIGITRKSVQGIYSIDLKANEQGIQEAAQYLGIPFRTFPAEKVQTMVEERGLSRSRYVREKIGVDGVCEATSLLGTKQGELVLPKQKMNGVTIAISQEKSMSWESDRVISNT